MAKTISHCQGKGSLTHNRRMFSANNVDMSRTKDNVVFVNQPIEQAYDEIFGAAVERYNTKQKRADRKIKNGYFEHAFNRKTPPSYVVTSADKRKSFYEDVVQIGKMDDTGVAKLRSERDNLQRKLDRVMEFIKSLGLVEKLQAFLNPRGRGVRK